MKALMGTKVGMTQIYDDKGRYVSVTVLSVGPCTVVSCKTSKKHGYSAVQLGYGPPPRHLSKAAKGMFEKAGVEPRRYLKEFPLNSDEEVGQYTPGQELKAEKVFDGVEHVLVVGTSKGKGFAGVMKRHGFSGGPATHGSNIHRAGGSIGASSYPSRVFPGTKMAGRMGGQRVTQRGLRIVGMENEQDLILVSGSVPGPIQGIVTIMVRSNG